MKCSSSHSVVFALAMLLPCCSGTSDTDAGEPGPTGGAGGATATGGSSATGGSGTTDSGPSSGGSSASGGTSGGSGGVAGGAGGTAGTAGAGGATGGNSAGGAAPTTGGQDATDAGEPPAPSTGPFAPVTDFEAPGPYGSTTIPATGPGGTYTVYRPDELAPGGAPNPIVGWMSGGATSHTMYTLLPHLASHGFVIVASDSIPGIGQEAALGQEIIAGIDWAIAEATRAGSEFEGKLDTTKIASMGYSMGSLATFTIASDPRLTTTVHISGGNMMPERVNNLHAPAAFLCGAVGGATCNIASPDCDIAAVNCDTDFDNATTPVFYGNFPGGHLGILQSPHMERIRREVTAWLRWQLMVDTTLESRFVGAGCTLCSDEYWQVRGKNL